MESADKCPRCRDEAIVIRTNIFGDLSWVALMWIDEDGDEVMIDYCPFCGIKLPDCD